MKKFITTLTLGVTFLLNACSTTAPCVIVTQNDTKEPTKSEETPQKEPNAELIINTLNQIQFSLSKIMATRNKVVLETELSNVLNHIDPQSLENDELIGAYEYLLNTLVKLKMTQSQRDALSIEIEKKRDNVKWEAVSNIGNAIIMAGTNLAKGTIEAAVAAETGGATAPLAAKDIAKALVPLANMSIFTMLNIKKLHGEITTDSIIRSMALDDTELEAIDHERISLFTASARSLKGMDKSKNVSLIQENEMKAFGELITKLDDPSNVGYVLNILENSGYKQKFQNFVPYQHALIKAYSIKNDPSSYNKMKLFYASTKGNSSIYNKQNPYARESARYMAIMAVQESDNTSLKEYITDLRDAYPQIAEEKIDFHLFAFPIYLTLGLKDDAKNTLEFLKGARELNRESEWNYLYYCKETSIGDSTFCNKAERVWNKIQALNLETLDSNSVHYGCFFREDYKDSTTVIQTEENLNEHEIKENEVGLKNKTINVLKKGGKVVYEFTEKVADSVGKTVNDILDSEKDNCLVAASNKESKDNYNAKGTVLQIRTIVNIKDSLYTLKAHKYGDRVDDKNRSKTNSGLVIDELKYKF